MFVVVGCFSLYYFITIIITTITSCWTREKHTFDLLYFDNKDELDFSYLINIQLNINVSS